MVNPQLTLTDRFWRLFVQEFWKPVWERLIDGAIVIAALVYANSKRTLSPQTWRTNFFDVLFPFIWAMCFVALIHLIRTGFVLARQVAAGNASTKPVKHSSGLLRFDGTPDEEWVAGPVEKYFRIKIAVIVVVLSLFPVLLSYVSWKLSYKVRAPQAESDHTEHSSSKPDNPKPVIPPIVPAPTGERAKKTPHQVPFPLISDRGQLGGMTTPVQAIQLGCTVYDWPNVDDELHHDRASLESLFHLKIYVLRMDSLAPGNVRHSILVMQVDSPEWNNSDAWRSPSAFIQLDRETMVFTYQAEARRASWGGYLIVRKVGNYVETEEGLIGGTLDDSGRRPLVKITIFRRWDKGRLIVESRHEYHELTTERLRKLGVPEVKPPS